MKTSSHHYATIMDPPSTDAPGHHYATIADSSSPSTAPHYESINDSGIYAKGKPVDLLQHKWYHGNISDEQVNKALGYTNNNVFLVRQSASNLILSKRMFGWVSHDIIHRSPEGYRLEGKEKVFESVAEVIVHYQQFPITGDQILGSPADKQLQVSYPGLKQKARKDLSKVFKQVKGVLKMRWRRCADSPVSNSMPPIVKLGDDVFVGCGLRKPTDSHAIYKYSISGDTWSQLPDCPTFHHGLATFNNELLVIGGLARRGNMGATNAVYTLRDDTWQQILPHLPTPRYFLSTLTHKLREEIVIAAGGTRHFKSDGEFVLTDVVEIYFAEQWHSTKHLPFPLSSFSMCISADTCYTLGGTTDNYNSSITLYSSISSLVESAIPVLEYATPKISLKWKRLRDKHPLTLPSVVDMDGELIAMGGSVEQERRQGTKVISMYSSSRHCWAECSSAELPLAVYRPGLVNLGNNEVMVVGGQPKSQAFSNVAYIGSYVYYLYTGYR